MVGDQRLVQPVKIVTETVAVAGIVRLDGRGTIAFSFVNAPPPHKVFAITGGSGAFDTRGEGTLDEHGDGTGTLVLRLRPEPANPTLNMSPPPRA